MIACITGIDGCGKSTQIRLLNDFLIRLGHDVFISKAYGPEEKAMFSGYVERSDPLSRMFIFQAFHNEQCLNAKQAEAAGKIVLADRWDESYLAYHSQFGSLSMDEQLRSKLNELAFRDIKPDITFFLMLPPEQAQLRLLAGALDFFDRLPIEYHQKMSDCYCDQAEINNWMVIDGREEPENIHQQIVSSLKCRLKGEL